MKRAAGTMVEGSGFDEAIIEAVWKKGNQVANLPSFRKDRCGASMMRQKYGQTDQFGWEIDHIIPVSKGGTDDLTNLQPLQWENNRHKGDNHPDWSCKVTS